MSRPGGVSLDIGFDTSVKFEVPFSTSDDISENSTTMVSMSSRVRVRVRVRAAKVGNYYQQVFYGTVAMYVKQKYGQ